MFAKQNARILNVPTNGDPVLEELKRAICNVLGMCQGLEHTGTLGISATLDPNANQDGSLLRLREFQSLHKHTTAGTTPAATDAHALYVDRGTARFNDLVFFQKPVWGTKRKATATANWDSGASTVTATDDATGAALTITLYSNSAGKQPNVRSGDTIRYEYQADGTAEALSEDDPIGTKKEWVGTVGSIRGGWALMDGTANSAGSGIDMRGRYSKGLNVATTSIGDTGGAATHQHASQMAGISVDLVATGLTVVNDTANVSISGSVTRAKSGVTVTAHSTSENTDFATTDITIDNWDDQDPDGHSHTLTAHTTAGATSGTDFNTYDSDGPSGATDGADLTHSHTITEPNTLQGHRHSLPELTHTVVEPNVNTGHDHADTFSVSDAGHGHGVSDPTHQHTVTDGGHQHDAANNEPPFAVVAFIERIS